MKLIMRTLIISLLIILTEEVYSHMSPSSYSSAMALYLPSLIILLLLFGFNYIANRVEKFSVSFPLTMVTTLIGTVVAFVWNVFTDDVLTAGMSGMPGEIKSDGWNFLITIVVFGVLLLSWFMIYVISKLIKE